MKYMIKLVAVIAIIITVGIKSSTAQNPNFQVNYSGCELACLHYTTVVTYAIVEIPYGGTATVVVDPVSEIVVYPNNGLHPWIENWDCDQSSEKTQYIILIHVDRYDDKGVLTCSGDLRTNPMPCRELYVGHEYTVLLN